MSEISKADLKKEIQEILKDADLDNTSAKKVRKAENQRTQRVHYFKRSELCFTFLLLAFDLYYFLCA